MSRTQRLLKASLWGAVAVLLLGIGVTAAVARSQTHRPKSRFEEPLPSLASGVPGEALRLTAEDSISTGAWLWKAPGAAPCVVLLHGHGGSRTGQTGLARLLTEHGDCVFAVSLRGHGDSDGDVVDFGWSARKDVIAAVRLLQQRQPGHPIYVFGSSLGAAAAIFAGGELAMDVRGYMLESPFHDLRTAVSNRLENLGAPRPLVAVGTWLLWNTGRLGLPVSPENISPIDHVQDIPSSVPMLFLAGTQDTRARLWEVRELVERAGLHARLEIFPGADHGGLFRSDPERYEKLLIDFVNR